MISSLYFHNDLALIFCQGSMEPELFAACCKFENIQVQTHTNLKNVVLVLLYFIDVIYHLVAQSGILLAEHTIVLLTLLSP